MGVRIIKGVWIRIWRNRKQLNLGMKQILLKHFFLSCDHTPVFVCHNYQLNIKSDNILRPSTIFFLVKKNSVSVVTYTRQSTHRTHEGIGRKKLSLVLIPKNILILAHEGHDII